MTRDLKYLGFAVVAALAMGAMLAPAAQAAPEFQSEVEPTIFEGSQEVPNILSISLGLGIKCTTANFKGTLLKKAATSLTLTPQYQGCQMLGFNATFKTNGCTYVLKLVDKSNPPTSTMDIACPPDVEMEISSDVANCTVYVPAQAGLGHVIYANQGTGKSKEITVSFTVSGIVFEETGTKCIKPDVQQNQGEYTGTATIKGYEDTGGKKGAQVGIWVA